MSGGAYEFQLPQHFRRKAIMNGYVRFETPEGESIVINVDRVNFVRRYRGGDIASAINFEKGNYVVVKGSLEAVTATLSGG